MKKRELKKKVLLVAEGGEAWVGHVVDILGEGAVLIVTFEEAMLKVGKEELSLIMCDFHVLDSCPHGPCAELKTIARAPVAFMASSGQMGYWRGLLNTGNAPVDFVVGRNATRGEIEHHLSTLR